MPDLFDNLFNKIGMAINGKSSNHYSGPSQVNSGSFYNYHNSATNNKYWLPTSESFDKTMANLGDSKTSQTREDSGNARQRLNSAISIGTVDDGEPRAREPRSRMSSVSSEEEK